MVGVRVEEDSKAKQKKKKNGKFRKHEEH